MALKFSASLSFLFQEYENLMDRYMAAKRAGFTAVEVGNPYTASIEELKIAKEEAEVEQVLINGFIGDTKGLAAVPGKEDEFKQCLELSIDYAEALGCKKIHPPCGAMTDEEAKNDLIKQHWEQTYVKNLKYAAERLEKAGMTLLIEPVTTIPNCFLTQTKQAIDIIKKVGHSNLKLMLDLFHAQSGHGNLSNTLTDCMEYIDHIQISQVPHRSEPDSDGEINYPYILNLIAKLGYKGWIGCEYNPRGKTIDGLGWMTRYQVPP